MTIINTVGGPAPKPIYVEAVEDTPSTLPHTYQPSEGYDYLSSVTVGADPNLQAGNIKQGVSIFGVEGTYEPEPAPINIEKLGLARSGSGFHLTIPSLTMEWSEYVSENPLVFGYDSDAEGYIAYGDSIRQGWVSTANISVNVNKLFIPNYISAPVTISGEHLCTYTNNADFVTAFPLKVGDVLDMQGYLVASRARTCPLVNENNPMRIRGTVENNGIRVNFSEVTLTFVSDDDASASILFVPYVAVKVIS